MGMDYTYSGSASYPRFNEELAKVAEIFGGIPTKEFKEKLESDMFSIPICYRFSWLQHGESMFPKFVFPDYTGIVDAVLVKWFNDVYGVFTPEETKMVWDYISQHPEIETISSQIYHELQQCVENEEEWGIC